MSRRLGSCIPTCDRIPHLGSRIQPGPTSRFLRLIRHARRVLTIVPSLGGRFVGGRTEFRGGLRGDEGFVGRGSAEIAECSVGVDVVCAGTGGVYVGCVRLGGGISIGELIVDAVERIPDFVR